MELDVLSRSAPQRVVSQLRHDDVLERRPPSAAAPRAVRERGVCASSSRSFRTKNDLAVSLVDRALEYVRPRIVVFDTWYGLKEVMTHIDSQGLVFVTESKSNGLIEDGGKKRVRRYLVAHQDEFVEVDTGTEYRFVHEVVSKTEGDLVVRFVLLKKARDENAIVPITNALDVSVRDMIISYGRR